MGFMANRTKKQYEQKGRWFYFQLSFTQNSLTYPSPSIFSEKKSGKE